jgi:C4-dicarboxylate-specific signal transduction histidine kinase
VTNSADAVSGRPEPRIVLSAFDARSARRSVFDNSKGCPPPRRQPLKPVTNKRGGTGLGLVLVKKTLASMGGVVDVSSVLDEGTRVRITLPKA